MRPFQEIVASILALSLVNLMVMGAGAVVALVVSVAMWRSVHHVALFVVVVVQLMLLVAAGLHLGGSDGFVVTAVSAIVVAAVDVAFVRSTYR